MAEPITLDQLKNASLDAKTLEAVINGDDNTDVTSRLGETYPTLAKTLNAMNSAAAKQLGRVNSIAALRNYDTTINGARIIVDAYYENGKTGGGEFIADLSDSTTLDDGGACIVSTSGVRWKRLHSNAVSIYDFGAVGDGVTNDTAAFTTLKSNLQGVWVDLLGKTYLVDTYPRLNKYYNGIFIVNGKSYNAEYNTPYNRNGVFASAGALSSRTYNPLWSDSIVAIGRDAMQNMTDIRTSIAIGSNALGTGTKSRDNIAIGDDALFATQSRSSAYDQAQKQGTRNIAIGGTAGRFVYEGYGNTFMGRGAGQCVRNGNVNIAIGVAALGGVAPVGLSGEIVNPYPMDVSGCVAVGAETLVGYQGDDKLTAVGGRALANAKKLTTITAIGANAGAELDSEIAPNGKQVLWTGTQSGTYTQNGTTLTLTFSDLHGAVVGGFVGIRLLSGDAQTLQGDIVPVIVDSINGNTISVTSPVQYNTSGGAELKEVYSTTDASSQNGASLIVGSYAQSGSSRAYRSVALGTYAAQETPLNSSVVIGHGAGRKSPNLSFGVAVGNLAMSANANYSGCIAIGSGTLNNFTDGSAITTLNNSVAIGGNATVSGNNQIQLGVTGQTVYAFGAVQDRSDARDKIIEGGITDAHIAFFNDVEFKRYRLDYRDDYIEIDDDGNVIKLDKDGSKARKREHVGVIAQQVEEAMKAHNVDFAGLKHHAHNGGNDIYTIGYQEFIPIMGQIIQNQQKEIDSINERLSMLIDLVEGSDGAK